MFGHIVETRRKKTLADFRKMKEDGVPLSWITAYDYPLAQCAEAAGVDMILVGDSGGMTQLGYATTNPVTMDEMIVLAKAVRRGAPNTFIVGDMPQGSYEISVEEAVRNALRFIKEAGCDAIKCEGGIRVIDKVEAMVKAGIAVIGHLGLTPQSTVSFGGYKVQGKTPEGFKAIVEDALALQNGGVFCLLLEAMPTEPAGKLRDILHIPVYGIGAGKDVDGQLIIIHDLLGFYDAFRPYFAKCFVPTSIAGYLQHLAGDTNLPMLGRKERSDGIGYLVVDVIKAYIQAVTFKEFPNAEYSYKMKEEELTILTSCEAWTRGYREF